MTPEADQPVSRVTGDLVVIQRNPGSGSGQRRRVLHDLIGKLRRRSWQVRMFHSRRRLDAFVQQKRVTARLRCLVAAGGDGTVASLVNRHPGIPVAVLPMGTENLISRHLKIPPSGAFLADMIDAGRYREFDTVQAGSGHFLIMASAGVDADVVHRLHAGRTGNIRHWSYLRPILRSLLQYDSRRIRVTDHVTGKHLVGCHAVVSNFSEYGLKARLNPDADPADGQLDVCLFQGSTLLHTLTFLVCSLFRTQTGRHVVRFRSNHLSLSVAVHADRGPESADDGSPVRVPLQFDGDPAGHLPVEFTVNRSAMKLLVHPNPVPAHHA